MADTAPGLERVLAKLIPRVASFRVELTERGVEIRTPSLDPLVLADLLEQKIDDLLNKPRYF